MRVRILFVLVVLLVVACKPNQPQTAEEVVGAYIQAMARYDFKEAAYLSTPEHKAYLEALAAVIGDDPPAADSTWVEIDAIACETRGNTMICLTSERDAFENSEKEYWLSKRGNAWRIDQPQEDATLERSKE